MHWPADGQSNQPGIFNKIDNQILLYYILKVVQR